MLASRIMAGVGKGTGKILPRMAAFATSSRLQTVDEEGYPPHTRLDREKHILNMSDINYETMGQMERKLSSLYDTNFRNLSEASFPKHPFPVVGRINSNLSRLIIPLVVKYTEESGSPRNVIFVVDTGCPVTILSKKTAEALGASIGTGPSYWVPHGEIHYPIELQIQENSCVHQCIVPIDDDLKVCSYGQANILGMDVLRQLNLTVDIKWDLLRFSITKNQRKRVFGFC